MPELANQKHEQFCREYVVDLNGTQAAIRAGYRPQGARTMGSDLLAKPNIFARVEELKAERWRRLGMGADEVVARLARVAQFDARKMLDDDGQIKPASEWDDATAGAVSGLEVETRSEGGEDSLTTVRVHKVKTSDRIRALELLGKHHGIFEKDNSQQRPIMFDVTF